jgi:hypothetical protein
MFAHARCTLFIALLIAAPAARADVYQCIDAAGKVLLTDSVCPPEYRTNLVVSEPQSVAAAPQPPSVQTPPASEPAAAMERRRLEAEAEADLLRDQLEMERQRSELARDRLEAIEDQLDALADVPTVYGGVAVPFLATPKLRPRALHGKSAKLKDSRPCRDCRSHVDAKRRVVPRETRRECGTFGCAPTITHAPWDDKPRGQRRRLH